MNESAIIHDHENGVPDRSISPGSVRRISKVKEAIDRGEKIDWRELYGLKPKPNYDFDFSQLNINDEHNL